MTSSPLLFQWLHGTINNSSKEANIVYTLFLTPTVDDVFIEREFHISYLKQSALKMSITTKI